MGSFQLEKGEGKAKIEWSSKMTSHYDFRVNTELKMLRAQHNLIRILLDSS